MSNNILVKDNFFDKIDELRELSYSLDHIHHEKMPVEPGWKGYRTWELSHYDSPIIQALYKQIIETVSDYFGLVGYDSEIYSHESYKEIEKEGNRIHIDPVPYAGVLYLTPDIPLECGTTIFLNDERVDIENKYNRLILYRGTFKHGITNFFGDNKDNVRRTINFFIDIESHIQMQKNYMEMFRLTFENNVIAQIQ